MWAFAKDRVVTATADAAPSEKALGSVSKVLTFDVHPCAPI